MVWPPRPARGGAGYGALSKAFDGLCHRARIWTDRLRGRHRPCIDAPAYTNTDTDTDTDTDADANTNTNTNTGGDVVRSGHASRASQWQLITAGNRERANDRSALGNGVPTHPVSGDVQLYRVGGQQCRRVERQPLI